MLDRAVRFPEGFLWGAGTAAHQVEGNNRHNDWWVWEQQAHRIADGSRSGNAVEWWDGRAEEDLRRAALMGHNAHRLSVEWSRLEPAAGRFNPAAFKRYREILGTMKELGLTPSVTLHHFTLPQWAALEGGWCNANLVEYFARFSGECLRRLGDLVDWWATINEPMILVYMGYAGTRWPPGAGSLRAGFQAAANLLRAHHAAYLVAKSVSPDSSIGIVFNLPLIEPAGSAFLDRTVARAQDWVMNGMMLRALDEGTLGPPLVRRRESLPAGPNAVDWYGLNYYGRHRTRFDLTRPGTLFGREVQQGIRSEETDWGEIYPEGLTKGLLRLAKQGKPLFVTENGIFDNRDRYRPAYLLQHIRTTYEALKRGADVRGYFHWTLIDNFEWAEGWRTRFGLIEVNPVTQERHPRYSAEIYEQVIRNNGIIPSLWEQVVGEAEGV